MKTFLLLVGASVVLVAVFVGVILEEQRARWGGGRGRKRSASP
jgi:hypothetical protein